MRIRRVACYLIVCLGGAGINNALPAPQSTALSNLSVADGVFHVPGLMSCTDDPNHSLHLNPGRPVYILVHGCFGSSGQFRSLAQLLSLQGQQTVCFTYNDRARLTRSAMELHRAIDLLTLQLAAPRVTVIGHSQGALIAHKALTYPFAWPEIPRTDLRLVTVSGPFGGIAAARPCGKRWLYPLTFGLLPLSCYAVTGAKWLDITNSSPFIREPGVLGAQVSRYLKIDTNEDGACRRLVNGRCMARDLVFSLAEQSNADVESDQRTRRVEVHAGHVEIVGDEHASPTKLIGILLDQGAIPAAEPDRLTASDHRLLPH